MDDSYDLFEGDDEGIDLSSIQYKPMETPKKKDVKELKEKEKAVQKQAKEETQMIKKMMKKPKGKGKKDDTDIESIESAEKEMVKKQQLIFLMGFMIVTFPNELKSFKKINLQKKSLEELENLRKQFDIVISSECNIEFGVDLITGAIYAMELLLVNLTPINCTGLTNRCSDESTLKIMKHITVKYCNIVTMEPEQRLMMKLVFDTMQLHARNSVLGSPPQINEEIIRNINSKFADL